MKRSISILIILLLLIGTIPTMALAATQSSATVSFRIEGLNDTMYSNSTLAVSYNDSMTLADVVSSCNALSATTQIDVTDDKSGVRVTAVNNLRNISLGGNGTWMLRVNGMNADDLLATAVVDGDSVDLYYGNEALIQYPQIDFDRMMTNGIIHFVSEDTTINASGQTVVTTNPIAGARVVWDGMAYLTDVNGEIIIDSTGVGVQHTVQIDRYDGNGVPTVLRFESGHYVQVGFNDVAEGAWYFEAVMFASEKRLLTGVSAVSFAPDAAVNRAMFVTVLGRLTKVDADQMQATVFPDVLLDGWSAGYISWAADNGLVLGYSDGTFGQYDNITREQIAVLLHRYAQFRGLSTDVINTDLSGYPDANDVSDYAQTAMRWTVERGIINGIDGYLKPLGTATRAQVATMLQRFIIVYNISL